MEIIKETCMPYVKKWGNSLALRIPVHLAQQLNLQENTELDCTVADGILMVRPAAAPGFYTLKQLLDQVIPEHIHAETDTGAALPLLPPDSNPQY
jgi:antitoxin MazE